MKYLGYDDRYWIVDIETDSLTPSVIWVCCVKNLVTGEEKEFYDQDTFLAWVMDEFHFVGHNILSFDLPALARLWGLSEHFLKSSVDTLVCSYLYNPALEGGHSLEAWGQRLKVPKYEFKDFSRLSPEMVSYCHQDSRVTAELYKQLTAKMRQIGYSELSCQIEHQIRLIINEQQNNGFWFDEVRGRDLYRQLIDRQSDLSKDIHKLFPPVNKLVKECRFSYNKDGSLPARIEKARSRYDKVVIDYNTLTYQCYLSNEFNIGSPKQRVERLLELGWKPDNFTKKGFPKVDEDALVKFAEKSGLSEVTAMSEWLVLQGRSSMIQTWLDNLGSDSRIHGRVNSCGAATRRMLHSKPNSANIPSGAKAKYGHECRALWGVEPNKGLILVGADASGLENVGLLHYLKNKKAEELLTQSKPNDVHSLNARKLTELLGREIDREWGSKTSYYATLYGAYPPKLASIIKGTVEEGEIVQQTILQSVPGLDRLIKEIQYEWKTNKGRLETIDGGFVVCDSMSAALNYKIQSLGAIVMKLAAIIMRQEADKQGLWFKLVGTIHDEFQMEAKEQEGDQVGKLSVWSMSEAARQLKFNLPLDGDYRLGQTWNDTH